MEKDRLLLCINRFDHYYDSINNKAAVYLALSTFIVGGLCASYSTVIEHVVCNNLIYFLYGSLLLLGLVIMILVAITSSPFLKSKTRSLVYFGAISALSERQFENKSKVQSDDEELDDLRTQVHNLASGLTKKFKTLRCASILFTIQFSLFIPLILLFISNFRNN